MSHSEREEAIRAMLESPGWEAALEGLEHRLAALKNEIAIHQYSTLDDLRADQSKYRQLRDLIERPLQYFLPPERR